MVISLLAGKTTLEEIARGLPIFLPWLAVLTVLVTVASTWVTRDLRAGRMRVAEGKAKLSIRKYRGTPYYRAKIGRKTFHLMHDREFHAFHDGEPYRVYYVRYWPDIILSVERE